MNANKQLRGEEPQSGLRDPHVRALYQAWWPLSLSWLCLSFEAIVGTAAVSRMPDKTLQLAAFASVVYPVTCFLESPIYGLLSTANTLCVDRASLRKALLYSVVISGFCSFLQLLFVLPPIYRFMMEDVLKAPAEVIEASYLPMWLMLPTSILVGLRRFYQGVLVRLNGAKKVGRGSALRIGSMAVFLLFCVKFNLFSGAVAGTLGCVVGVIVETLYAYLCARRPIREMLPEHDAAYPDLTPLSFARFYTPLAFTSMLTLLIQPIIVAGINRSPDPLTSLVVWPIAWQICIALCSISSALPELYVGFKTKALKEPGASLVSFEYFTRTLLAMAIVSCMIIAVTPLARIWFEDLFELSSDLSYLATITFVAGSGYPIFRVLTNYRIGEFLYRRETFPVTEAIAVFLVVLAAAIFFGMPLTEKFGLSGATIGGCGVSLATAAQALWLWARGRVRPQLNTSVRN